MGRERKVKQAISEMFKAPQHGDMLMRLTPGMSYVCAYACDREYWNMHGFEYCDNPG